MSNGPPNSSKPVDGEQGVNLVPESIKIFRTMVLLKVLGALFHLYWNAKHAKVDYKRYSDGSEKLTFWSSSRTIKLRISS